MESAIRFIGWFIINIDMLLLAIIALGGILYLMRSKKWAKRLAFSGICGFFILGIIPIGFWMFTLLENRFPKPAVIPEDAVGVILLGGPFDLEIMASRHETVYNLAAGRLIEFIEFTKAHPNLKRVFSGGGPIHPVIDGKPMGEAEIAKRVFERMGYDDQGMIFEGSSKNTIENAWKTKEIIQPKPGEKWILMTSAFHMPRSVGLFEKAGWEVVPYPVDYHAPATYEPWFFIGIKNNLLTFHYAIHQFVAMFQNYIFGRSDELFPGATQ